MCRLCWKISAGLLGIPNSNDSIVSDPLISETSRHQLIAGVEVPRRSHVPLSDLGTAPGAPRDASHRKVPGAYEWGLAGYPQESNKITLPETNIWIHFSPWKSIVGRWISCWNGLFSGAKYCKLLVSGTVGCSYMIQYSYLKESIGLVLLPVPLKALMYLTQSLATDCWWNTPQMTGVMPRRSICIWKEDGDPHDFRILLFWAEGFPPWNVTVGFRMAVIKQRANNKGTTAMIRLISGHGYKRYRFYMILCH